jgi:hypothetical protein
MISSVPGEETLNNSATSTKPGPRAPAGLFHAFAKNDLLRRTDGQLSGKRA